MTDNSPNSIANAETTATPNILQDAVLLDVPAAERVVLLTLAGLVDLGRLRRYRVCGGDRLRWLNGMVTNNVQELAPNEGAWNLVLNAQGRIQGDLEVWRGEDGAASTTAAADELEIQLEAAQVERLIGHLEHFIIMDDVELLPVEGVSAIGVYGPMAETAISRLSFIPAMEKPLTQKLFTWKGSEILVRRAYSTLVPRYELWIDASRRNELWNALAGTVTPVGFAAEDMLRIVEGIPRYGVDLLERDLPQESSQMRALHFNKGCYQGQEIVERIHSRGNVHKHLRMVEFLGATPVPGTELKWKNAEAGVVRSVAVAGKRRFGLGMIRAEAEVPDAVLEFEGGRARLLSAPPELNESV